MHPKLDVDRLSSIHETELQQILAKYYAGVSITWSYLQNRCNCVSEITMDCCELKIEAEAVVPRNTPYAHRAETEVLNWARANLTFEGCSCCSGDQTYPEGEVYDSKNSDLHIVIRMVPITAPLKLAAARAKEKEVIAMGQVAGKTHDVHKPSRVRKTKLPYKNLVKPKI